MAKLAFGLSLVSTFAGKSVLLFGQVQCQLYIITEGALLFSDLSFYWDSPDTGAVWWRIGLNNI